MYQALGKGFAMPNAAEMEILKNKDSKNNNVRRLQILNTWRDHMNPSACGSQIVAKFHNKNSYQNQQFDT